MPKNTFKKCYVKIERNLGMYHTYESLLREREDGSKRRGGGGGEEKIRRKDIRRR